MEKLTMFGKSNTQQRVFQACFIEGQELQGYLVMVDDLIQERQYLVIGEIYSLTSSPRRHILATYNARVYQLHKITKQW